MHAASADVELSGRKKQMVVAASSFAPAVKLAIMTPSDLRPPCRLDWARGHLAPGRRYPPGCQKSQNSNRIWSVQSSAGHSVHLDWRDWHDPTTTTTTSLTSLSVPLKVSYPGMQVPNADVSKLDPVCCNSSASIK